MAPNVGLVVTADEATNQSVLVGRSLVRIATVRWQKEMASPRTEFQGQLEKKFLFRDSQTAFPVSSFFRVSFFSNLSVSASSTKSGSTEPI